MAAGFHPRGFIAPAWLLSPEGERAVRDAELEYTNRLRTITDLRSGDSFPVRSLVYSVRNSGRRATSLAWNAALATVQTTSPAVRMSIHPPDRVHPRIWAQIRDLVMRMQEQRTATTYCDWIAEQRLQRSNSAP
jgi:hypothetical protein